MASISIRTNNALPVQISSRLSSTQIKANAAPGYNLPLAPANTTEFEISRQDILTLLNGVNPSPPATATNVLGSNIANLIASYDGASFSSNVWSDNTGSYDTNASRGTVSISSSTLNGYPILEGSTAAGLRFPPGVLPSTFTFFHVTRYNGTEERIFDGVTSNWLDGFWDGNAGVAYHDGWITSQTDHHGTNWVLSTSQNSLYRSNGVTRGTSGGSSSKQLSINHGQFAGGEASDWQCAEVIVFDRHLNSTEYGQVEQYLSKKYGIALNGTVATSWPFGGNYGGGTLNGARDTLVTSRLDNYDGVPTKLNFRESSTITTSKSFPSFYIPPVNRTISIKSTGIVNNKLLDGDAVVSGGGGGGGGGGSDSAVASTIKQIWY